jgi:hypothetical protein
LPVAARAAHTRKKSPGQTRTGAKLVSIGAASAIVPAAGPPGSRRCRDRHFAKLAKSAEAAIAELSADKIAELPPEEQFKYLLAEVKKAAGLREMAQACARDAASYVHPRLSSTAVKVQEKRDRFDWTTEELIAIINESQPRGKCTAQANGCGGEPDNVH